MSYARRACNARVAIAGTSIVTVRQDRLEFALARALQSQSTRSALRDVVHQLVDLFRLQGVGPETGVARIRSSAMRATLSTSEDDDFAAGDAPAERIAIVMQWARQRYARGD